MLDSGSTSLGIVRTVLVLSLLNRLVLILLDLAGPKKLHALMGSWRFDAGWPSAKTASGALRNPKTKALLCATSTMGWCTLQSLLLFFLLWKTSFLHFAVVNGICGFFNLSPWKLTAAHPVVVPALCFHVVVPHVSSPLRARPRGLSFFSIAP